MTEALDDRPTIAERYVRATATSNLKIEQHRFSDADLVAAAGLVAANPDAHKRRRLKLGGLLYRLVGEYDAVRAEAIAAERRIQAAEAAANIEAKSVKVGPTRENLILQELERRAVTDHLMILCELKTLREAANELGFYAALQAKKKSLDKTPSQLNALSGRVMDVFLDPKCRPCNGLGFVGSAHRGEMQTICRGCKGSTKRAENLGRDTLERDFGGFLLKEMEAMISEFERAMVGQTKG
jgi:hypothetical protein